jgi:hypothetical protein
MASLVYEFAHNSLARPQKRYYRSCNVNSYYILVFGNQNKTEEQNLVELLRYFYPIKKKQNKIEIKETNRNKINKKQNKNRNNIILILKSILHFDIIFQTVVLIKKMHFL